MPVKSFYAVKQTENRRIVGYKTYATGVDAKEDMPDDSWGYRYSVVKVKVIELEEKRGRNGGRKKVLK